MEVSAPNLNPLLTKVAIWASALATTMRLRKEKSKMIGQMLSEVVIMPTVPLPFLLTLPNQSLQKYLQAPSLVRMAMQV